MTLLPMGLLKEVQILYTYDINIVTNDSNVILIVNSLQEKDHIMKLNKS